MNFEDYLEIVKTLLDNSGSMWLEKKVVKVCNDNLRLTCTQYTKLQCLMARGIRANSFHRDNATKGRDLELMKICSKIRQVETMLVEILSTQKCPKTTHKKKKKERKKLWDKLTSQSDDIECLP